MQKIPSRLKPAAPRLKAGDSWRADKQGSTARGYGYQWQKARADYLQDNPLCVMCKAQGIVREARVVDHRIPHTGPADPLFWDRANWQALCFHCHNSEKQRQDNATKYRRS